MSALDNPPKRVAGVTGSVARAPFGGDSKSRHVAVWIDTGAARYVLRRKGGPAMGDKVLDRYVGHEVRCDGVLLEHTLLAERIEIIG
jgi:hypothetical protein